MGSVKITGLDLERRSYQDERGHRQLRLASVEELAGLPVEDVALPAGWRLVGQRFAGGWLWLDLAPLVVTP